MLGALAAGCIRSEEVADTPPVYASPPSAVPTAPAQKVNDLRDSSPPLPIYRIQIDPHFSEDQVARIYGAVEVWQEVLQEVIVLQPISFPVQSEEEEYGWIKIYPNDIPDCPGCQAFTNWSYTDARTESAIIRMRPDFTGDYFSTLILHELGHALGLNHSDPETHSIMYHDPKHAEITCFDRKNVCAMWGCDSNCL